MRIAVAGKGGSGKTTIAGTLARLLGRRGRRVVAIDGDNNPNLAQVLGVARSQTGPEPLPGDLLVKREVAPGEMRVELREPVDRVLARHGRETADRVRLVLMSRVDHAGAG